MNVKFRTIEIDSKTADTLEAWATARGITIAELLAELAGSAEALPSSLEELRSAGRGPWAPEILAEDARRFADFERTGEGVPWEEIQTWMRSWGSVNELPSPKPRKL